jgi:hypothetical protein
MMERKRDEKVDGYSINVGAFPVLIAVIILPFTWGLPQALMVSRSDLFWRKEMFFTLKMILLPRDC